MSNIKLPALDTPVTVLCDLTRNQLLNADFIDQQIRSRKSYPNVRVVTPTYGAPYIQHEIYRILCEASVGVKGGAKYVIIITNNLQISALAAVLMNGRAEKHLDAVPVIDPHIVRAWEVWDDSNVLISEEDGLVVSTSFDEAFRPIVSDIMRIQRLNATKPENTEEAVEQGSESETPKPRILEKAVVDEGVIANSPKDIIQRRIDAIQDVQREESDVPMKQS